MAELNWKGKIKNAVARKVAKKMDARGLKWHELKPGHKIPGLHQKWVTVKRVKKYPKRSGVGVEFKEGGYDIRDWDDEV